MKRKVKVSDIIGDHLDGDEYNIITKTGKSWLYKGTRYCYVTLVRIHSVPLDKRLGHLR